MPVLTLNGVPAEIASIKEKVAEAGLQATVVYHVAWADRYAFLIGLAGTVQSTGDPATGTITRVVPHKYPDLPDGWQPIYAQPDIDVEPLGTIDNDGAGWATYRKASGGVEYPGLARVTVIYRRPAADPEGSDAYKSENLRGGGSFLTLPGAPFTFAAGQPSAGRPINQDAGIWIPEIDIQWSWERLPYIDDRIFDMVGKVNATEFRGRAPGTVLCAQPEASRNFRGLGGTENKVGLSFVYKYNGWNHIFSNYSGQFELVDPAIYDGYDFASVLDQWVA
jgi:hypothetical protein